MVPSAEEAIEDHVVAMLVPAGTRIVHDPPPFALVQRLPVKAAAAIIAPSADEASEIQNCTDEAALTAQATPALVLV